MFPLTETDQATPDRNFRTTSSLAIFSPSESFLNPTALPRSSSRKTKRGSAGTVRECLRM